MLCGTWFSMGPQGRFTKPLPNDRYPVIIRAGGGVDYVMSQTALAELYMHPRSETGGLKSALKCRPDFGHTLASKQRLTNSCHLSPNAELTLLS